MTSWYVTARLGHRTAHLSGPYATRRAAAAMLDAVERCARMEPDERYAAALYRVARLDGDALPPGILPLTNLARVLLWER